MRMPRRGVHLELWLFDLVKSSPRNVFTTDSRGDFVRLNWICTSIEQQSNNVFLHRLISDSIFKLYKAHCVNNLFLKMFNWKMHFTFVKYVKFVKFVKLYKGKIVSYFLHNFWNVVYSFDKRIHSFLVLWLRVLIIIKIKN